MWNNKKQWSRKRTGLVLAAASVIAAVIVLWPAASRDGQSLTRAELDLRDGVLFEHGRDKPFNGSMIEDYAGGPRKLIIDIRDGKADGVSRGWHDNGQLDVEETLVDGVSHGVRTRWHLNGTKKSEAMIDHGKITGRYVEWHDNGQKAAEVTMVDGRPDGLAEAWYPSGALKSRIQLSRGEPVERKFFPDKTGIARAATLQP